jgi:hypothetical protein
VFAPEDRAGAIGLAAVIPCFLHLLPGVGLQRGEGALKESVIDNVALAVFPLHNPVSTPHMAETKIGSNGLFLFALRSID